VQRSNDAAQKDAQNKSSTEECAEGMEQKEHALPMVVQNRLSKRRRLYQAWNKVCNMKVFRIAYSKIMRSFPSEG
jgi:hypothetical protein